MKLIAVVGDQVTQECAHIPCVGAGTFTISPSLLLNDFFFISNKLVLLDGDQFEAHCTATLVASSNVFFINGIAVVRADDSISSSHSNNGVECIQQNFVRSK